MFTALAHFKPLQELVMENRSSEIFQRMVLKKCSENIDAYYVFLYVEF